MSDKSSAFVLDDYALEEDFAVANGCSTRTTARMRREPDGLPWMLWNGKVYVYLPGARAYVARKTKRPNPSRRAVTQQKRSA